MKLLTINKIPLTQDLQKPKLKTNLQSIDKHHDNEYQNYQSVREQVN
jgi:hypothetical protein